MAKQLMVNPLARMATVMACMTFALALSSCAEQKAYEDASRDDTIYSYRKYLDKYPNGEYSDLVYDRVEDLYFKNALERSTPEAVDKYIKEYPKGRFIEQAHKARVRF